MDGITKRPETGTGYCIEEGPGVIETWYVTTFGGTLSFAVEELGIVRIAFSEDRDVRCSGWEYMVRGVVMERTGCHQATIIFNPFTLHRKGRMIFGQ